MLFLSKLHNQTNIKVYVISLTNFVIHEEALVQ